jgi:hypothetical protein
VAVDNVHVWWTANQFARGEDWGSLGAIRHANLDGTGAKSIIPGPESVIGSDFSPCGIGIDDRHVYWRGLSRGGNEIGRAKLDGALAKHEFIETAAGCGVAVDALPFTFGKVKKNRKKGTAKLTVKVPGPGELELAKTNRVKADKEEAAAEGKEKLRVKSRRKARLKLNRKGKAKVKAKVTFTPDGGEPNTQSKPLKLVKR